MEGVLVITGRSPELQATVFQFGNTQFMSGQNSSLGSMLQAQRKVGAFAIMNVTSKLIWGVGVALGIALNAPFVAFALPSLVSETLKAIVLFWATRKAIGLRLHFRIDKELRAVFVACFPFFVNSIAITLGGRLDVSMLEFLASGEEVGWYSAANNFAMLAMLLSPIMSGVLMPLLARAKHRSEEEFFEILRRSLEAILVAAIPVTLVIGLGADLWVRVAFGAKFAPAAVSLRVLAPIFIATYTAMLLSMALIQLGRAWQLTVMSLIGLASMPVLVFAAVPLVRGIGPGGAGAGLALGVTGMEVVITALFLRAVGRRAYDRRSLMAIGKSLIASAVAIVVDRLLVGIGAWRLIPDMLAYVIVALALGAVHISEVVGVVRMVVSSRRKKS
jgi:O-antigen/teichoic acid export membrane protein